MIGMFCDFSEKEGLLFSSYKSHPPEPIRKLPPVLSFSIVSSIVSLNINLLNIILYIMTVIVPEPDLSESNSSSNKEVERDDENNGTLQLDGGFLLPNNNAFGHSFRDYEDVSERKETVEQFYRTNHINQTYEFAKLKKEEYEQLNRAEMSIWECCELLNEFVDESDPDLDEPQIEHLLQTAEAIRRDYPDQDWLHLTALIHDLGKVLLHESFGGLPQWCVVGDTFPLGCAFDESIVHHQYFKENPDSQDPVFSRKLGIYSEKCGLDRVIMSWGHDEYMYLVAKENKTSLPPAALFIIRFHSFYALHRSGAYEYLMNDEDKEMLKWLLIFK
ncbi:inositol oxygenase 1-like protein [Cinnamomum micranthum f. kanehirae]|uniref:Inositol oxygenase n=1 Tax=Cinnamomum micranthum f. kanehirae TaxID=337451 RepID=A0A443NW57_9MAGN|nr:inositol oxygenase 1-like protein [Cinnamomum micranthum f. kanehirae]